MEPALIQAGSAAVVLDYPDLSESAGITLERTADGLRLNVAREPFRKHIQCAVLIELATSALFTTIVAVAIAILRENPSRPICS